MIVHRIHKGIKPPRDAHQHFDESYDYEFIGMISTVETNGYITINFIKNDKDKDWFSVDSIRITRQRFHKEWGVLDIKE